MRPGPPEILTGVNPLHLTNYATRLVPAEPPARPVDRPRQVSDPDKAFGRECHSDRAAVSMENNVHL